MNWADLANEKDHVLHLRPALGCEKPYRLFFLAPDVVHVLSATGRNALHGARCATGPNGVSRGNCTSLEYAELICARWNAE